MGPLVARLSRRPQNANSYCHHHLVARHPALRSIGLTSLLGIGTGVLVVFTIPPIARRSGVYNAGRRAGGTNVCRERPDRAAGKT